MFDKENFSIILKKINSDYPSMTEFAKKASLDRSYISKYINQKLTNPPTPKILLGIANASNGKYTYLKLMQICGYMNYTEDDIKKELENKLKNFNLTEQEYINAINCFMHDSEQLQSLAFTLKFCPDSQNKIIEKEKKVLLTILNFVLEFVPNDLEIGNNKEKFYKDFSKALEPAKKILLSLDKEDIISNSQKNYARIPVLGSIPAGVPIELVEDIIDYEDISADMLKGGKEYFAVKVKGNSMEPKYLDGDVLIVLKQSICDHKQDCIVMVNGDDGTFKRVFISDKGIKLQPLNSEYESMFYTNEEVEKLPVKILGVVKEIRRTV